MRKLAGLWFMMSKIWTHGLTAKSIGRRPSMQHRFDLWMHRGGYRLMKPPEDSESLSEHWSAIAKIKLVPCMSGWAGECFTALLSSIDGARKTNLSDRCGTWKEPFIFPGGSATGRQQ